MSDYRVNDNGIIVSPGKFEGESAYVPSLYDGESSETIYDGDRPCEVYIIDADDVARFPELSGVYAVVLVEDDNGFVTGTELSETRLDAFRADCENAEPTTPDDDDLTTEDSEKFYQSGRLVLSRAANGAWYRHDDRARPAGVLLGHFGEDERAAVRAYMEVSQHWPNVWTISDHGNAHLWHWDGQ